MRPTDLARLLGIAPQRLSQYESGKHDPPHEIVLKAAEILGVPTGVLIGTDPMQAPTTSLTHVVAAPSGKIPLMGTGVAGHGNSWSETEEEPEAGIEVPVHLAYPDYGALRVKGDSMMPFLRDGDTAIFRENKSPVSGRVCAVRGPDGALYIKKTVYMPDGKWVLRSLNPAYDDKEAGDGYQTLGQLVGFYRDMFGDESFRHNRQGIQPEQ